MLEFLKQLAKQRTTPQGYKLIANEIRELDRRLQSLMNTYADVLINFNVDNPPKE